MSRRTRLRAASRSDRYGRSVGIERIGGRHVGDHAGPPVERIVDDSRRMFPLPLDERPARLLVNALDRLFRGRVGRDVNLRRVSPDRGRGRLAMIWPATSCSASNMMAPGARPMVDGTSVCGRAADARVGRSTGRSQAVQASQASHTTLQTQAEKE